MTNIYLVVDYSTRMFLSNSQAATIDFISHFVDAVDQTEVTITMIAFDGEPRVIGENVSSSKDVQKLNLYSTEKDIDSRLQNFRALSDLIFARQFELTNYEVILIFETSSFVRIPDDFRLPCAVNFVSISQQQCVTMQTTQFEMVSRECAVQAGLKLNNNTAECDNAMEVDGGSEVKIVVDDFKTIEVITTQPEKARLAAVALAKKKRTENDAVLSITSAFSIEVYLTPGLSKRPFAILSSEVLCKEIVHHSDEDLVASGRISPPRPAPTTLNLLGFVKSANFLFHLPCTSLVHAVKPKDTDNGTNLKAFHVFAEALGSEGQLAIFQHPNGEECVMRALRSDLSDPWLMCMQFYSSNYFTWSTAADAVGANLVQHPGAPPILPMPPSVLPVLDKSKLDLKGISYKANTVRSYWTDSHGLQSDIMKITRLLKRADRVEQFYQEVQRISRHAVACGYHSFAETMATLLEKRCVGIPPENRDHLTRITSALRQGGFRLASQTQP